MTGLDGNTEARQQAEGRLLLNPAERQTNADYATVPAYALN
ncbi:MAG: hypothetical protein BIP78_1605 [Candidatus Bipolaricaulis sibiricus]|uniref:Uncharacterized protein n=1 Tax=Bipolaricaulis sibiricus TaxID=2501609 RepID=A0A410FWB5_BIPS1|nr:MAG: hypothetical protein BIP78_1605 [Candidatus Bipolaricaulis sibiricus]